MMLEAQQKQPAKRIYILLDQKSQKSTQKWTKKVTVLKKVLKKVKKLKKVIKKVNSLKKIPHTGDTNSLNRCGY